MSNKVNEQIKVTIGGSNKELTNDYDERGLPVATANIDARRDLAGNYRVTDHTDFDIMIMPKIGRVVTVPKQQLGELDDTAYAAQERFYDFMVEQGVVDYQTIQGGHIIGTMEAKMLKPKKDGLNPIQVAIFTISKFIEKEKPNYIYKQALKKQEHDRLFDPDEEYSTELGEVPHAVEKGSITRDYWPSGANYRVYEARHDDLLRKIFENQVYPVGMIGDREWSNTDSRGGGKSAEYSLVFPERGVIEIHKRYGGSKSPEKFLVRFDSIDNWEDRKREFISSQTDPETVTHRRDFVKDLMRGHYGRIEKLGASKLGTVRQNNDLEDYVDDEPLDFTFEVLKRKK